MILAFPDAAAARDWYESPAYQEARQHRLRGGHYRFYVIDGTETAA